MSQEVQNDKKKQKNMQAKAGERSKSQKIALSGVFVALAMILSYLESLIPLSFSMPGIKLGLANIVTILALNVLGLPLAVMISLGRILLSGFLFGNLATILYSLAGATLSILVMWIASKWKIFSMVGVSVLGAVFHNIGQVLVATVLLENTRLLYYLLVLVITGTISGIIIGILAGKIMKNISF